MTDYEELKAQAESGAGHPPLASWSGDEAAKVAALLLDSDTPADTFYATVLGRPTLAEQRHGREKSVQRNVRMPKSMDEYVSNAVEREGLNNRSEYFRLLVEHDAQAHRRESADV